MDTGKIFLGIALLAFSVVMAIHPASAAVCDSSCPVGYGDLHTDNCVSATVISQDPDSTAPSQSPAFSRATSGTLP
ncbi:MAG: hypothetical protein WCH85_06080 [Methanomicrobiales archaeon]